MSSELAPLSSYLARSLGKVETFELQEVAARSALLTEMTKIANHEVARIGAHTVGTMANLVQDAGNVRNTLLERGHRSDIFDDAQSKILQVTGQNLITMANTTQQQIVRQVISHMP